MLCRSPGNRRSILLHRKLDVQRKGHAGCRSDGTVKSRCIKARFIQYKLRTSLCMGNRRSLRLAIQVKDQFGPRCTRCCRHGKGVEKFLHRSRTGRAGYSCRASGAGRAGYSCRAGRACASCRTGGAGRSGGGDVKRKSPHFNSILLLHFSIKCIKIKTKIIFCFYFARGDVMPRVAYSEKDKERIRTALITVGLELMAKQGIQHTTVEQVYKKVGISRTFFYSFFSTKEDLVLETLYWQQPRIVEYVQKLMADPALTWRDTVKKFLYDCCYGEKSGIAVLTIEEQQLIFKRLSKESYQVFRQKQRQLFGKILETFGIEADARRINLFTNLSLTVMVIRRALPDTLPLFVPEAADQPSVFEHTQQF